MYRIPAQSPPVYDNSGLDCSTGRDNRSPATLVLHGDHYLKKSYTFQSENDLVTEQFRVDNPSWGIEFDVTPLNDNINYCWFVMTVTNLDTGNSDTYGYGRENSI